MGTAVGTTTRCSFCAKEEHEVSHMVAGPGVHICDRCVSLCQTIFAEGSGGSADSTIPYWQAMTDEELLVPLPRIASVATQVEDDLQVWVQRTRARGVSWAASIRPWEWPGSRPGKRFAAED